MDWFPAMVRWLLGGRFVLLGLALPGKNSSLAEFWRKAAFFGKEDLTAMHEKVERAGKLERM